MNISVIIWNGFAACSACSGSQFSYGCGRRQLYALSCCCNSGPLKAPVYLLVRGSSPSQPSPLGSVENISSINNQRGGSLSLPYKDFLNINKVKKLTRQYYVHPYAVGTDKRSLVMIIPSGLVESLNIDPLTILFLLKVVRHDELQLRIIRQDWMERKNTERTYADNALNRRSTIIENF